MCAYARVCLMRVDKMTFKSCRGSGGRSLDVHTTCHALTQDALGLICAWCFRRLLSMPRPPSAHGEAEAPFTINISSPHSTTRPADTHAGTTRIRHTHTHPSDTVTPAETHHPTTQLTVRTSVPHVRHEKRALEQLMEQKVQDEMQFPPTSELLQNRYNTYVQVQWACVKRHAHDPHVTSCNLSHTTCHAFHIVVCYAACACCYNHVELCLCLVRMYMQCACPCCYNPSF